MTDSAAFVFGLSVGLLTGVVLYVWTATALAAVFRKAGEQPWKAWVPFYNGMTLLELGGFSGWLFLLVLVPAVGALAVWVLVIVAAHRIGQGFGRGAGMTVLAALLFPVWASILGWGSDRWVGAPLDDGSAPVFPGGAVSGRTAAPQGPTRGTFAPSEPAHRGQSAPSGGWVRPAPPLPPLPADAAAPAAAASGPSAARPGRPSGRIDDVATDAGDNGGGWAPAPAAPTASPSTGVPPVPADEAADAPTEVPASADRFANPTAPSGIRRSANPGESAPAVSRTAAADADPAPDWTVPRPAVSPQDEDAPAAVGRVGAPGMRRGEPDETPEPGSDEDLWAMFDYEPSLGGTSEVTGAVPGAPGPISAIPGVSGQTPPAPPAAPPVTRVPVSPAEPAREPWAPATDAEALGASGEVSAIAGAPDAGAPRAARASVSAQHPHAEIPDDSIEETVIARRRRTTWTLGLPAGRSVALTADAVILGRRPNSDPAFPGAQLVPVDDPTISKTHARLELRGDEWYITDLDSTNGVVLFTSAGVEVDVAPGVEVAAGERFVLGDAELRLQRADG